MPTQTEFRELVFGTPARASRQTLRVLELMLVLAVAFGTSLSVSAFAVFGYPLHGDYSTSPALFVAIATELIGLSVLGYVYFRQGRDWRALLGQWRLNDIAVAIGLLISRMDNLLNPHTDWLKSAKQLRMLNLAVNCFLFKELKSSLPASH